MSETWGGCSAIGRDVSVQEGKATTVDGSRDVLLGIVACSRCSGAGDQQSDELSAGDPESGGLVQ